MKRENLMPSAVLGCICLVVALLLSGVNMITAPEIAKRQEALANAALVEVLPGGSNFKEITLTEDYPAVVTKGYTADGGYVFEMTVAGYKPGLVIMCGIDSEGKIVGVKHLQSSETYGLEAELNGVYIGDTLDSVELIIATGATKKSNTSQAYYDAVKAALQAAAIAGGAEVDTRTPEQILQDNCNAALGVSGIVFEKWFAEEILTGIDAVYEASDDSGRVYLIGEAFVGIKADGTVATADATDENKNAALLADGIIDASTLTETAKPTGAKRAVKKISVTATGNYVFEVEGKGYAAEFGGKSILIKVCLSSEGAIVDIVTVSHSESKGYGDLCATDEYYKAWIGATAEDLVISSIQPDPHLDEDLISEDCTDIGAISSATFTTYGYQKAVQAVFEAFDLLTGGDQ